MPTEISSTRASGSTARPRLFETSRKRLVIPRSSRAGWSAIARSSGGRAAWHPPPGERLLDGVGRGDLARRDLRLDRLQLGDDRRGHVRADLADACAVVLGGEEVRRA